MGYMGLESWKDSDAAADMRHRVLKVMIKELNDSMKEVERFGTNTDGIVNVALFIESGALQSYEGYELESLNWKALINGLQKHITESHIDKAEEWKDEANRIEHNLAYKRMLRAVKHFIDKKEIRLK